MDTKEFNVERFSAELSRMNKEYQKLDDTPYNQGAKDVLAKVIYELTDWLLSRNQCCQCVGKD